MTGDSAPHVLVLDEGTTSTRAVLFDPASSPVLAVAEPLGIETRPSGEVEQDAIEIWDKSRAVLREVVDRAGTARSLAGIGIPVQRTTTVLWDRTTGVPVAPVISWQDTRCSALVEQLSPEWSERFTQVTGLAFGAANLALHLAWIFNSDADLRRRAQEGSLAAGTPDSWIVWNLTGGSEGGRHLTSTSCAGSSGAMNVATERWWTEFLDALGVPERVLPKIVADDGDFGTTTEAAVGAELPITAVIGDQQSALFGHGGFAPGSVKCTHGTGSFVDFNIGSELRIPGSGLDCRVAWRRGNVTTYMLEGGSFVTGSGVSWLVDGVGVLERASVLDATYAQADPRSGLVCVPALAGFAAPYWDANARGLIVGLNRGTTKADVVRATLDGIAQTVTDLMFAMRDASGVSPTVVAVDGGLGRSTALLQAQADLMQTPIVQAAGSEFVTARGAAWLAGIRFGVWASAEMADATKEPGVEFQPAMPVSEQAVRRAAWADAVNRTLGWRRADLSRA